MEQSQTLHKEFEMPLSMGSSGPNAVWIQMIYPPDLGKRMLNSDVTISIGADQSKAAKTSMARATKGPAAGTSSSIPYAEPDTAKNEWYGQRVGQGPRTAKPRRHRCPRSCGDMRAAVRAGAMRWSTQPRHRTGSMPPRRSRIGRRAGAFADRKLGELSVQGFLLSDDVLVLPHNS
eukprot:6203967-Pleurochrysis_carterae.AAC.2